MLSASSAPRVIGPLVSQLIGEYYLWVYMRGKAVEVRLENRYFVERSSQGELCPINLGRWASIYTVKSKSRDTPEWLHFLDVREAVGLRGDLAEVRMLFPVLHIEQALRFTKTARDVMLGFICLARVDFWELCRIADQQQSWGDANKRALGMQWALSPSSNTDQNLDYHISCATRTLFGTHRP